MLNIVLFQPEIPQNTGTIARLCVCNDLYLHLIHPIGFSLAQKQLLRAGMDYWEQVKLYEHRSWEYFLDSVPDKDLLFFLSSKSSKNYWEARFPKNAYLVFGSETHGLPQSLHQEYGDKFYTLPMYGNYQRCLNLSNSVSIAAYEALRQYNH
ncbi:MAG: tRNA (cytidine(34)-2'-O)-methyltransferase [Fibrobacteria bacterium]|nr:tRNA (cytidine(34)-2'-O)-methyltransferase [Fibrobacteria bacterium]